MFVMYRMNLLKKTYFSTIPANNDNWVGWKHSSTVFQSIKELAEVIDNYKPWGSSNIYVMYLEDGSVKSLREFKSIINNSIVM